jgi:hypothetical protein
MSGHREIDDQTSHIWLILLQTQAANRRTIALDDSLLQIEFCLGKIEHQPLRVVKPDYLGLEPPLPANTDTYALFGWRDRHA